LALHQALHRFRPLDDEYAGQDYNEAFNWSDMVGAQLSHRRHVLTRAEPSLAKDIDREWYCVVFRSRRRLDSASLSLYKAAREAYEEAVKN